MLPKAKAIILEWRGSHTGAWRRRHPEGCNGKLRCAQREGKTSPLRRDLYFCLLGLWAIADCPLGGLTFLQFDDKSAPIAGMLGS